MTTFVLTWNGSEEGYPSRKFRSHQIRTRRGEPVRETWSFGPRTGGISKGDRVFLLRQRSERGIVASGRIRGRKGIYRGKHWDPEKADQDANYAEVTWDTVLSTDQRIPTETLQLEVPTHGWNYAQSSGQLLSSPGDVALEILWRRHLEEMALAGRPDPGVLVEQVESREAAPAPGRADAVGVESFNTVSYVIPESLSRKAVRRESDLVKRFEHYLTERGSKCVRYKIVVPDESVILFTDTFDKTCNVLYEAKGASTREAVRSAVGQLLDYRRHIPSDPDLAVLVPSRPSPDLIEYLTSVRIQCWFDDAEGFRPIVA